MIPCKSLVLDAGPLLSLSPLRGLAEHYVTVPQVLSELKDKNAREHFDRLALITGVKVEVLQPDAASISKVTQFARTTGDYSVLSYADICVLALTLALDSSEKKETSKQAESLSEGDTLNQKISNESVSDNIDDGAISESIAEAIVDPNLEELAESVHAVRLADEDIKSTEISLSPIAGGTREKSSGAEPPLATSNQDTLSEVHNVTPVATELPAIDPNEPLFEDPSDEDDGEGDWITPSNVDSYKTQALHLFPTSDPTDAFTTVGSKRSRKPKKNTGPKSTEEAPETVAVGCMTADFAMQNVLLQMGLNLVGTEGKRIQKVKTWVLRCHACFKICKDPTKKFCPSCGNATLLRTSVTAKAPTADETTPALEVHLKKNFVYRNRGTKYSIPKPKPGTAKGGNGEGLILREDQIEYLRAVKHEENRRDREEKRILKQSIQAANAGQTPSVMSGNWMDPDWLPEMLTAGAGGKGRHVTNSRVPLGPDGMPLIGYGRKNPNERRRKR